jgi:hypothetical protein
VLPKGYTGFPASGSPPADGRESTSEEFCTWLRWLQDNIGFDGFQLCDTQVREAMSFSVLRKVYR